jgi:hypothetical protein
VPKPETQSIRKIKRCAAWRGVRNYRQGSYYSSVRGLRFRASNEATNSEKDMRISVHLSLPISSTIALSGGGYDTLDIGMLFRRYASKVRFLPPHIIAYRLGERTQNVNDGLIVDAARVLCTACRPTGTEARNFNQRLS